MQRPNILLLYTDQLRWDALGINGNPDVRTPNLDRLAREGLNFDHFFVQNPVCMPSRVSFLSGQYPGTLGITHMGVPVPPETPILPRYLKNYGYRSANLGKLHFLPHSNRDHREVHPDYGFDQLENSDEPGCYQDAYAAWVARVAPEHINHISCGLPPAAELWYETMSVRDSVPHPEKGRQEHVTRPFAGPDELTHTAFVADRTLEFLRANQNQTFLCVSGFYSPHSPWIAPQRYLDLYDPAALTLPPEPDGYENPIEETEIRQARQGYYAMVSELDHHIGRILDRLKELGLEENTIVLFTSDHGEWLGEHGRYGKSYPGHDCVSRVPCLVRWPAGIKAPGRTVSHLVEAVDVVPTLLEASGIPVPEALQGISMMNVWRSSPAAERGSVLMEERDWKSVRTERFRYICHAGGREALFDLEKEDGEYTNIAASPAYAPFLAMLRQELLCRLLRRERPLPRTWVY